MTNPDLDRALVLADLGRHYFTGDEHLVTLAAAVRRLQAENKRLSDFVTGRVIASPDREYYDRAETAEAALVALTQERDALRDNIATLANGVVEITADKLVLNREIDALRAQLSTMTQAVGLATTASPTMEMNAADPIGMMQTVCAEVNALREQLKQVESVLAALQQGQGEREEAAFRLGWANRGNQWNPNAPLSVEVAIAAWRASQKGTP